jgi:hypothetical protein
MSRSIFPVISKRFSVGTLEEMTLPRVRIEAGSVSKCHLNYTSFEKGFQMPLLDKPTIAMG